MYTSENLCEIHLGKHWGPERIKNMHISSVPYQFCLRHLPYENEELRNAKVMIKAVTSAYFRVWF